MTGGYQVVTTVSIAIIALAMIALGAIGVVVGLQLRRTIQRVDGLVDQVKVDIAPVTKRISEISGNVAAITSTVRTDIDRVSDTVSEANDSVREALVVAEQRLHHFSALLAVVQEEAEGLFVTGASAVRGVRGGAAAFRRRTDLASDELDAVDDLPSADDLDIQEVGDGHDDDPESAAEARPAAPRIAPRAPKRRRA